MFKRTVESDYCYKKKTDSSINLFNVLNFNQEYIKNTKLYSYQSQPFKEASLIQEGI